MTSPGQRSQQQQKRMSKPFIPALPILPKKKLAEQETKPADTAPPAVELSDNSGVRENAVESPITKDLAAMSNTDSPAHEESLVKAVPEVPKTVDEVLVADATDKAAEHEDTAVGEALAAGVTSDGSGSGLVIAPDSVQPENSLRKLNDFRAIQKDTLLTTCH